MADPDLRAKLDPLLAVMQARPQVRDMPPAASGAAARAEAYTDPTKLPPAVQTRLPDGSMGIDLPAQLALVQAALGRFADLQIRTVTGQATFASLTPLVWLPNQYYDVDVAWSSTPLAPVKGAVARVDASIVALGRIQAAVLDDTVSTTGCKVRCRVFGAGNVTIGIGTPLTVSATGLYLYWPPFEGTTT